MIKKEITTGTLLHGVAVIGSLIGVYVKLQQTIDMHSLELRQLEKHISAVERKMENDEGKIDKLQESQVKILQGLEHTTTILGIMTGRSDKK